MNTIDNKCYCLIQKIPKGRVTTYKIIAEKLGIKAYRLIGQIMKRNPYPKKWPCHRVIMSNGKIGGYAYGKEEKIALLCAEGLKINNDTVIEYSKKIWMP